MIIDPKDDVLISELPRYIRKALQEFDNVTQQLVSYNCSFESGTLTGDAVYFDAQSNVYRRSLVGSAVREKFTGIADVERARVTHLGAVEIAGMDYPAGVGVFVSELYQGHLTDKITTLQIGIVIVPGWLMVGQSAANARHYYDQMQSFVDEAEDQAQAAATSAASSATSAGQAQASAQAAQASATNAANSANSATAAAQSATQTLNTVFPAPVPGYFLAWDNAGHLVTMPVVIPDNGDDNPITDGGVGDGSTDTAPIIQNIISKVAPGGQAKVYLPPGVWKLSSTLLASGISLTIQGSGKFTTTLLVDSPSGALHFLGTGIDNGLAVMDMTIAAGRLDAASGDAFFVDFPVADSAVKGEHLLFRNVRFRPQEGFTSSRKWFTTPVRMANCAGSVFLDVEFDFHGYAGVAPSISVENTTKTSSFGMVRCKSAGLSLLKSRGGLHPIVISGCEAESAHGVLDIEGDNCSGLSVHGCRFVSADTSVNVSGHSNVSITGNMIASNSASVTVTGGNNVVVSGNTFEDSDPNTAGSGPHVVLHGTTNFVVDGNQLSGFTTSAITLTQTANGRVCDNNSKDGQYLIAVNSTSNTVIRENVAHGNTLIDLVIQAGVNTGLVIQDNLPPGNAVTRFVVDGVIDVSGAPNGNILVDATAPGNVTDMIGGHEGMMVHLKAKTVHPQTFVYAADKIITAFWDKPNIHMILYDDTANGGGPGRVSFLRINGVWTQMSYGT